MATKTTTKQAQEEPAEEAKAQEAQAVVDAPEAEKTTTVSQAELDAYRAQLIQGGQNMASYSSGKVSLADKLFALFKGDDIVIIKNFTDHIIGWAYADKKDFHVEEDGDLSRKVYGIGKPRARVVEPGKSVRVPGYEAYVGLARFFDNYVAETSGPGELSVRMNSPLVMDEFISKAYGGEFDPNEPDAPVFSAKQAVDMDLGLVDGDES